MLMVRISQGLGNQMFQYAFGECLKEKYEVSVYYDCSFIANKVSGRVMRSVNDIFVNPFEIANLSMVRKISGRRIFRIPVLYDFLMKNEQWFQLLNGITWKIRNKKSSILIQEPDYWDISAEFISSVQNLKIADDKDYYFNGFWESTEYIKRHRSFLQKRFQLKISDNLDKDILKKIVDNDAVSIHIRRGDYITKSNNEICFNLCTKEYYDRAIQIIKERIENPLFVVFSDDIPFAKSLLLGEECIFVEGNKDYEDLFLMSQCKHNIIANSTFSFWGAFLNSYAEQHVVAPRIHYVKKNQGEWKEVLFPHLEEWNIIDNSKN